MVYASVPMVLGVAADMFGCGYHRIQSPAAWIAQSGAGLANVTFGYPPIEKIKEMGLSAIVCQRPRDEQEIKNLARIREDHGKDIKIIYEIDDLLSDVPEQNVHEAFQPPADEVDENIKRALSYCDWAVVPTPPLKDWLLSLKPDLEVKIIPNYLPELDNENLPKIEIKPEGVKARIGWGGSISHDGDLDLIIHAIETLETDKFKWVFLGHQPRADFDGKDYEFYQGVQPNEYLPLLIHQGMELVLAPLEDNAFNNAKSNLRLLQAGAIGAAVIASPVGPYLRDNPPVFAYANSPDEFKAKIEEWLNLPEKKKVFYRAKMRNWAKRHFGVKANLPAICNAWGIANSRVGTLPKGKKINGGLVVHGSADTISLTNPPKDTIYEKDLHTAIVKAVKANSPLLVAPYGMVISQRSLETLIRALKSDPEVASVCPMSNDGGVGISFLNSPKQPSFAALDAESNTLCDEVCFRENLAPRHIAFPLGPAVLMSPKALAVLPKPGRYPWDWGFLAAITGKKNLFVPSAWAYAPQPLELPPMPWVEVRGLNFAAVHGVLTVEERIKLEASFIAGSKSFLLGNGPGDATTWSQVFWPEDENAEDCDDVKIINFGADYDLGAINQIYVRFVSQNLDVRKGADHWMMNAATDHWAMNVAIAHNYVEKTGYPDVVFCDALAPNGSHFFKPPTFDREAFFALDYVGACCLVKTESLKKLAPPQITTRIQLYGVLLELVKLEAQFAHCAVPLYWEKETPEEGVRLAMIKHVFPEYDGKSIMQGLLQPFRKLTPEGIKGSMGEPPTKLGPSVSIIMLTTGKTWVLRQCLATLLKRTEYEGQWNIVIGRCGERRGDPNTLAEIKNPRVKLVELGEESFNWSRSNNDLALQNPDSDIFVFLNDDVLVTDKHWLTHMVAQAQRSDVGAVGIRLFVPGNGNLQHAGVFVGDGVAGHIAKNTPGNWPGYWGYGRVTHECAAVTGAALAVEASKFFKVKMFDERMAVNYSDVDFCLNLLDAGYKNICVCSAEMMHAESSSRAHALTPEWAEQIGREGRQLSANHPNFVDPYWNPNFKTPTSPNKWSIGGLNWDILKWEKNWQGMVLILNDNDGELIVKAAWRNLKPALAMVEKGRLTFIKPSLVNLPAIEIGEKTMITQILNKLQVKEIIGTGADTPEGKLLKEYLHPKDASNIIGVAQRVANDR